MTIDIIALAKEAGFYFKENQTHLLVQHTEPLEYSELCFKRLSDRLEAEIRKEFEAELAKLREVMIAAAEEIHEQWKAHCDDAGYRPSNLMHRLENGIAVSYPGYSSGAFQTLTAQNAKLMEAAEKYKKACEILERVYVNSPALTQPEKDAK